MHPFFRPITLTVAKCLEAEAYVPMFEPRRELCLILTTSLLPWFYS